MSRTIVEFLVENALSKYKQRLAILVEINAPEIMIKSAEKAISELELGKFKCGGDASLLKLKFNSFEVKTGKGGKKFFEFDNGVLYFPEAKYGRYITKKAV